MLLKELVTFKILYHRCCCFFFVSFVFFVSCKERERERERESKEERAKEMVTSEHFEK